MTEFSIIPEVNECLLRLYQARFGHNSQAIADVEFFQNKLYEIARNHWEELLKILKEGNSQSPDFLADIIWALRGIPDSKVVSYLKDIVSNHKDWEMRYTAIGALSRLRKIDLIETFVLALQDVNSSVQFRAVQYLEKFGDKRALIGLKNILKDKNIQKTCPGLIESASRAIVRIEKANK